MANGEVPKFGEGSVDGIPVFEDPAELAAVYVNTATAFCVGDPNWQPVPAHERTAPGEPAHVVASGENWQTYSDGVTLVRVGGDGSRIREPFWLSFEPIRYVED